MTARLRGINGVPGPAGTPRNPDCLIHLRIRCVSDLTNHVFRRRFNDVEHRCRAAGTQGTIHEQFSGKTLEFCQRGHGNPTVLAAIP
jgi:hypothetical protein